VLKCRIDGYDHFGGVGWGDRNVQYVQTQHYPQISVIYSYMMADLIASCFFIKPPHLCKLIDSNDNIHHIHNIHQNAVQIHDIKVANRGFENVAKFRNFGTTITNHNLIQGKIRGDLIRVILASIRSRIFRLLVCCRRR
jgi:hypothetical protein